MGIRIITDSASDVTQQEAAKWNVEVLPLTVRFGDEEYLDGITIDYDMFYNRLIETDVVPKTSQVTPFAYEKAFRKALDAGDDIICLTISSKLSGCYQSACIAADEMKERARIMIVDTLEVSMAEYILVQRAVQLRDQGYSADRIAETIEKIRGNVPTDLSYLAKQGVLLFNSSLTCEKDKPGSHNELWKPFTVYMMENVFTTGAPIIFLGKEAARYKEHIFPFTWSFELYHPAYAARNGIDWDTEGVFTKVNKIIKDNNGYVIEWL